MKTFELGDDRINMNRKAIPQEFDAVVVILFWSDKFVMIWNPERGWEFPGGHRMADETYKQTAIREVWEEAQIEIHGVEYLGYYSLETGHRTLIVFAECHSFEGRAEGYSPVEVDVFDALPSRLSFGDGREQLFLEVAKKMRNLS